MGVETRMCWFMSCVILASHVLTVFVEVKSCDGFLGLVDCLIIVWGVLTVVMIFQYVYSSVGIFPDSPRNGFHCGWDKCTGEVELE